MTDSADLDFDAKMRLAISKPPEPDFDAWLRRHEDAVAYLNPVVTTTFVRRRRLFLQLASSATAAAIIAIAAFWVFTPQTNAFAQTAESIKQAKTISWTIDSYMREYSVDGTRTWIVRGTRFKRSYLAPNKYRDVRYADDGTVTSVSIENRSTGEVLALNMRKQTATLKKGGSGQFGPGGPFDFILEILKSKSIEFVGQREVDGITINVFRHYREFAGNQGESIEIWLDAKSKRLVRYGTNPGKDFFDLETAPDRNNAAEKKFSKGTIAGAIHQDIVFDAQLDPSLFSLTPPAGFAIVEAKQHVAVTEDLMIQWLRLSAEANGGIFLELERGFNLTWHNAIGEKPESDLNEAEQKYMDAYAKHARDGNRIPVQAFVDTFTDANSFRYLGKGVELGNRDGIVCFYKLKSSGRYRVVYGDLTVADIEAKNLPLPIE